MAFTSLLEFQQVIPHPEKSPGMRGRPGTAPMGGSPRMGFNGKTASVCGPADAAAELPPLNGYQAA